MEISSELVALGFTEYEAKIYLALLKESPANGYQLSKRTGVPRSMVYEALGRLHTRGAVLSSGNERSTIYRPLPPEQLLDKYDRQYQILINSLHEKLDDLYTAHEEDALWSISGEEAIYSYASRMIQRGKSEVYLVMGDDSLERLRDTLQPKCRKELSIGALLTGSGDLDCKQVSHHPPAESEVQGLENMLVVVVDGQECLIADLGQEKSATVTTNKNLVLISHQFIWMELFAQRVYERLNPSLLDLLDQADKQLLLSFSYNS